MRLRKSQLRRGRNDDDGARVKPEVGAARPRETQKLECGSRGHTWRNIVQVTFFFVFLTEVVRDDLIPLKTSERSSFTVSAVMNVIFLRKPKSVDNFVYVEFLDI